MNRIAICGTCTEDVIDNRSYFGGAAGGIALNLAGLGIPVGLITILGDSAFSKKYEEKLKEKGVNVDLVKFISGSIPVLKQISQENSETARTFNDFGVYKLLENLTPSKASLSDYQFLHVVNTPQKLADFLANAFEGTISYCPGSLFMRNKNSLSTNLVKKSSFIFVNEEEYIQLQEVQDITDLFQNNLQACIITQGDKGVILKTRDQKKQFPVKKLKAVDVMGAGDALFCGFINAYMKEKDLHTCVEEGISLSSLIVSKKGVLLEE